MVTDARADPIADPVVAAFVAASRANACGVHGPLTAEDAAARAVALAVEHAAGGTVALANDSVTTALDLAARFAAAAAPLLEPDDPQWSERLPDAGVGVTGAALAIAATGTLVLVAGPGAPRATSLLPPVHVCVVRAADVVATIEEAVATIAARGLPSAVVWIGGPSRTGDLEMRQTLGIHGPKAVEVVVVRA